MALTLERSRRRSTPSAARSTWRAWRSVSAMALSWVLAATPVSSCPRSCAAWPGVRLGGDHRAGRCGRGFLPASDSAYAAVSNPVEGTILTVARAAARAAGPAALEAGQASGEAGHGGANVLVEVLEGAREAAARALEGTTQQLPALRAAGVVDAGGAGLLLLFDSFLHVLAGRRSRRPRHRRGGGYELGTAWAG